MIHLFLSYRRADTADAAGRLYDNLRIKLGKELVFHDVYNIAAGIDWHQHIIDTLKESDVVLAIIGPTWLTAKDSKGRRRLDDPEDTVRGELDLALKLGVPIIPVLVGSATMPSRDDFPDSLKSLYRLNAAPVRDTDFDYDFERLLRAIQKYARQNAPEPATAKSADEGSDSGDAVAATVDRRKATLRAVALSGLMIVSTVLVCVLILGIWKLNLNFEQLRKPDSERALKAEPREDGAVRSTPLNEPWLRGVDEGVMTLEEVQSALNRLGFYSHPAGYPVDKSLRDAIAAYQLSRGMDADGFLGARTAAALKAEK